MKRVFIAINLPDEIRQRLGAISLEIQNSFPHQIGKWVKEQNLHITLDFLGSIKDENLPAVIEKTEKACENIRPFKLKTSRIVYGPAKTFPPRLIWLELEKNHQMEQIAQKLEADRFLSHITLCRIKAWQWKAIEPEERPNIEQEVKLEFEVKSVDIMESVLKQTGPEYVKLESIALTNKF